MGKEIVVLNLGGEGEIPSTSGVKMINVNHPAILEKKWRCSRSGCPLSEIKTNEEVVVCCGGELPFSSDCIQGIILNGVPINEHTWMGPGYSSDEIERILKKGYPSDKNLTSESVFF